MKLAPTLLKNGLCLPYAYHVELSDLISTTEADSTSSISIYMSDMSLKYPLDNLHGLNKSQTVAAVRWLAKMHGLCWGKSYEKEFSLAREGCYWYLETRLEEWSSMSHEWQALKKLAPALSERLRDDSGLGWTLIHGDFKSTNLMFTCALQGEDFDPFHEEECIGIDFQYVGGGYGARDLAMLMVCAVDLKTDNLACGIDMETEVLQLYYDELLSVLREVGAVVVETQATYTMSHLRGQYELALMDLVRFMAGWGMWGNCEYACRRVESLIRTLDRGNMKMG